MATVDTIAAAQDIADAANAQIQETLNRPFGMAHGISPEVVAALTGDDDSKVVQSVTYLSTRKGSPALTMLLATGQDATYRPAGAVETEAQTIKRGGSKLNEWDRAMRDACAVRGGTIVSFPWAPAYDDNGFRKGASTSYQKIRRALDAAVLRLDPKNRARVDTEYKVIANGAQSPDASTVEGYVMVRITGARVK